jgi:hypothetical protein
MKQRITFEQLGELSNKGINRLKKWSQSRDFFAYYGEKDDLGNYLLSIGQLIEFLDEYNEELIMILGNGYHECDDVYEAYTTLKEPNEWCASLWEAVKEILEK